MVLYNAIHTEPPPPCSARPGLPTTHEEMRVLALAAACLSLLGIASAADAATPVKGASPGHLHGFLLRAGNFSLIDFPGAIDTFPTMIIADRIVGGYFKADRMYHGFLMRGTHFKSIDCPSYINLFLSGLNPIGEMTGGFSSADGNQHGALIHNGTCTQVDFPGSISTYANAAISGGPIVGRYANADGKGHGFVLTREGE